MRRLLISALLAVLFHAYWLRSNIGEGDGSSPGKSPKSVVISLRTGVQSPASAPRSEPSKDLEPTPESRGAVPPATQPVIKEREEEPTDADGQVDEDEPMRSSNRLEAEDHGVTADAPVIGHADRPVAQGTPKTKAKTNEARQLTRDKEARNTRQQSRIPKSKGVERENGRTTLARPQGGRYEPSDGVPDDRGKAQPNRGVLANRDASITHALKSTLQEARPIYKRNPRPPYPRVARRRGYEGTVIVRALVGMDGLVNEVRLDKSSGHETLDDAALQTVQRWAFEPAERGSEKIEMWVRIPLRFSLD